MNARTLAFAFAFAAITSTVAAQAPVVTTVLANGTTQSRYDMVILADGYQSTEQAQFDADVTTFLASLFQKSPYSIFADYYNVHTVFRASVDSGANHPDATPPIVVNNAYGSSYNTGGTARCLYITNTSLALADAALAPATEGRVMVLVNDSRYGGCASTFAVSYNGGSMANVLAHELGHSLGQLADEYDYPNDTYTGPEPSQVNVTTSPTGDKWAHWHGTNGISAFEGARYYLHGLYRPRTSCMMRSNGQPLCRVCQENVTRITNSIVDVITATSPTANQVAVQVPTLQPFSVTHFVPSGNNPIVEWRVDGALVAAGPASFVFDPATVAIGPHTVEAAVVDQSDRVRQDPNEVMIEEHVWTVDVTNPFVPNLAVTTIASSLSFAHAGMPITLDATIQNVYPGDAAAFTVDFFVGTDLSWSLQDTWLGKVDVAGLAGGQSTAVQLVTQLPYSLDIPFLHYVHAVVDRTDAIAESDEGDNEDFTAFFAVGGPAFMGLEWHDELVTPHRAELSVSAGGVLHPQVVAPSADPLTSLYLIVWGGSGTSPGIPLGAAGTLPLNPDSFTQVGLDAVNSPTFGAFLGLLDAQGRATATFDLPPTPALASGTTHFATLLLHGPDFFHDVSNAIELTLLP